MEGAPLDKRAIAALVTAAVAGVLANELGTPDAWLAATAAPDAGALWTARLWQTAALVAIYVVAPLVVALAVGARPRELGLGFGDPRRGARLAAGALAVALPLAFASSFTTRFRHVYPLFPPAVGDVRLLGAWLPLLAAMLLAVEIFYRGILLGLLSPALGRYALFVMVVPYALTHRDLVEALGAIAVGLFFGVLALRSRSIWIGWLVHVTVAAFVEVVAVWQAHRH